MKPIDELEKKLAFNFRDKQLLERALTHRSAGEHNERLEFLGDAVLSIVAAEQLYTTMKTASEGTLTQLRASYVCEANLARAARELGLEPYIRVAKSMRMSGPIDLPSLLSDVIEAIIGAAYLDAGLEASKNLILHVLGPVPTQVIQYAKDPKTILQEHFQAEVSEAPVYAVTDVSGPGHSPIFVVEVSVAGRVLATGEGRNKKEASQAAAKKALEGV